MTGGKMQIDESDDEQEDDNEPSFYKKQEPSLTVPFPGAE